jgi:RNA polymerase sigma-70 factor (ECF subfamily)
MSASDEALLAGMATGDTVAATAFVRRHQARVYGLALTVVGQPAVAEEVAQEAFARAWRYAGAYDPRRGRAVTWLLTITRNVAIDTVRVTHERPVDPQVLLGLLGAAESAGGRDRVEDVDRVRAALRQIPKAQAVAVVLATFYGLTAREIAARDGIPLGTAKTRIRLGLARLRDQLEVSDG